MAPIPNDARAADFKTGTVDGQRLNTEFDRLYADAMNLLAQVEGALGVAAGANSEILAARNGRANLDALLDELLATKAELETARNSATQGGAFASLDARLEAIDSRITSALSAVQGASEVVEARTDSAGKVHAAIKQAINNGSKDLEGLSLAAINRIALSSASIVDAIVYDTSRDSDGGAWRERCSHLSWFNETLNTATRGKTAKFPAIALIVATSTAVTIFDATDPTIPMWMVFNNGGNRLLHDGSMTSLSAVNGSILVGTSTCLIDLKFAADFANLRNTGGIYRQDLISKRNEVRSWGSPTASGAIVNATVNDVAATILPGAPLDPATGLPVPTVAVATAGGVSVIHNSGTVVNSAETQAFKYLSIRGNVLNASLTAGAGYACTFNDIGKLAAGFGDNARYSFGSIPASQFGWDRKITHTKNALASGGDEASSPGFNLLYENFADTAKGMVHRVTKDFVSGILPGDIRRAWLASGVAETLSGAELVTNGTFETGIEGWIQQQGTISYDAANKRLRLQASGDGNNGLATTSVNGLTPGARYRFSYSIVAATNNNNLAIDGNEIGWNSGSRSNFMDFVAPSTVVGIQVMVAPFTGDAYFDNISIKRLDDDRSVKAKGIGVYGSLTKAAVATGADLMGYSGFSATNYLEEPYSADLDFGTGDFCFLGWINEAVGSSNKAYLSRAYHDGAAFSGSGIQLIKGSDDKLSLRITNNGFTNYEEATMTSFPSGKPRFVAGIRRGSNLELYVDGALVGTDALTVVTASLSNANATLRIGATQSGATFAGSSVLSLFRLAAFAPSPEQIRMIYEYERHLFVDNAKCLLGGSSNAVQALDYDPDTDRLLVGTGNGVSVFQGLRRVDHLAASPLTNTSMKAVSGVNGAILMAGGAEAVYQAPQRNIREEVERVKRRFVSQIPQTAWFTANGTATEFDLPTRARRILTVSQNGAIAREVSGAGASKYTVLDYGYKQSIKFGTAPAAGDVGVTYVEDL